MTSLEALGIATGSAGRGSLLMGVDCLDFMKILGPLEYLGFPTSCLSQLFSFLALMVFRAQFSMFR